jgi:hypothetical protein
MAAAKPGTFNGSALENDPPTQQRQSGAGQQLIGLVGTENRNTEEKVWPVLKIDFKQLVVKMSCVDEGVSRP